MTIQTKFDVGDYAWYLYNDSWYLVEIESIIVIKRAYNVTGAQNLDEPSITYSCRWCEVTSDHPAYLCDPVFREDELYILKEKEESE